MFMRGHIEETSNRTGTLRVRLVSGRRRIYAEKTLASPRLPATNITILAVYSELPYQYPVEGPPCIIEPSVITCTVWCVELGIEIQVYTELLTVRALYDGLLVAVWTTAQKIPQHRWSCSAQLATVLVFLTTLTVVGRCYATASAEAPLGQFDSNPQSAPRPFYNSKFPTSSLVLSRLFIPGRLVKSDTRIIRENSKVLYNPDLDKIRTKREFKTAQRNRIADLKSKSISEENSTTFKNSNPSTDIFSLRTSKIFGQVDGSKLELSALVGNASEGGSEISNTTRVIGTNKTEIEAHQNDGSFREEGKELLRSTQRPMPPAHAHDNESSGAVSAFGIILVVVLLTGAVLGLVTCLLSHQRGTGGASGAGTPATLPHHAADSPTTAPMLSVVSAGAAAGMGGMDRLRGGRAARELAATRDRQVRLHAVHTDIAINLPHSIAMPDGEEHPFTSSRLHIRDAEQESEIYQKCIRPPPNRTVLESESPPPYRSSSAGVLASSSSSSSGSDWSAGSAPLVVRCHSMSSTSKPISSSSHPHATGQKTDFLQRTVKIFTGKKTQHHQPPPAPTLPVVVVPATSRSRRTDPNRPRPPPGV